MSIREYDEHIEYAVRQREELEERQFQESHYKVDGPAVIHVPAGYRACVYMQRTGDT